MRWAKKINIVYCSVLLGASLGSFLIIPLLYHFSPVDVIFLISAISSLATLIFLKKKKSKNINFGLIMTIVICFILFLFNNRWHILTIPSIKPIHGLKILQRKEENKLFEKWSPLSRYSVFKEGPGDYRYIVKDAGYPTVGLTSQRSFQNNTNSYVYNLRYLGHYLKRDAQDTLIIGSGGGMDVRVALYRGHKKIDAVEIDPTIVELVTKKYADFLGHLFSDSRVTLTIEDGRNFLARTNKDYDIIQIAMFNSWEGLLAGVHLFNENSLYTMEAIDELYSHLKSNGILDIPQIYSWDESLRLLNMIISYLDQQGIDNKEQRLAVVLLHRARKGPRAYFYLKKENFSKEEMRDLLSYTQVRNYKIIYAPHISEEYFDQSPRAQLFRSFIYPHQYADKPIQEIIENYPRNITPATDDKPFFYFLKQLKGILDINEEEPLARRLAMPILYGALIIFSLLSFLMIILPLMLSKAFNIHPRSYTLRSLCYFALLGLGYMIIEMAYIQKLTLFLGHRIYSFVVVLTTMLLSNGLGSLSLNFWRTSSKKEQLRSVLWIVIIISLLQYFAVYGRLMNFIALSFIQRIMVSVLMIFPIGFFLGMCFPVGMQMIQKIHQNIVPWGWAVNGAFSVLAPILSLVFSINFGLKATLLIGISCYIVALMIISSYREGF